MMAMNSRPCIYHFWLAGDCELCGALRSEMHKDCRQDWHRCAFPGPMYGLERERDASR